ncbi:MAG: aldo/keto reductase, partial [Terriglobia bacterium]
MISSEKRNRREFLGKVAMSIAGASAAGKLLESSAQLVAAETGSMPYRVLGRSGAKISAIGLGGYHIGIQSTLNESIRIIRTAIDNGITFMDNCWDYNDGESEVRMGKGLRDGYRQKVFLMTKIDGQVKDVAAKQIDDSLRRLQTDHLDLLQFHEVIRPGDPERIFGENGSIHAAMEARKAGKIRYIG